MGATPTGSVAAVHEKVAEAAGGGGDDRARSAHAASDERGRGLEPVSRNAVTDSGSAGLAMAP
jgi:hypothetical protein